MAARDRLALVLVPVVLGMVAALIYHRYQAVVLGRGYPYSTFLYMPDRRFSDLDVVMQGALGGHPSIGSSYPPFAAVVALLFGGIGRIAHGLAVAVLAASYVAGVGWLVWRSLPEHSARTRVLLAAGLALGTYPSLFLLDRANLDALVLVAMTGFALSLASGRTTTGAVWLGLAAAMKGMPLILLVILVKRRAWKAVAVCLGVTAVASLSHSLVFWVDPLTVGDRLREGVEAYQRQFALGDEGWAFGSSMLGLVKTVAVSVGGLHSPRSVVGPYEIVAQVATVLLAAYVLIVERVLWRQLCILLIALVLLPDVAADYRLTLLLVPLMGFLREGGTRRFEVVVGLAFAVLLVPKTFGVRVHPFNDQLTLDVVLNPIAMAVIVVAIVASGLRQRRATARRTVAATSGP